MTDHELAKKYFHNAGGLDDQGPQQTIWYWRMSAKLWKDIADHALWRAWKEMCTCPGGVIASACRCRARDILHLKLGNDRIVWGKINGTTDL